MRRFGAGIGACVVVLAVAACGFPDPSYESSSEAGVDGASNSEPGLDGRPGSPDGRVADDAASEGGAIDASSDVGDAGARDVASDVPGEPDVHAPDATADGGVDCDVDQDGYKAAGGSCGGTDCCDTDPSAHPGQAQYFPSADACGSFDYNCDAKLESEYLVNVTCGGTGLTGCSGGPGFTSDPACGTSAPYSVCQGSGALSCAPASTMSAVQGCH